VICDGEIVWLIDGSLAAGLNCCGVSSQPCGWIQLVQRLAVVVCERGVHNSKPSGWNTVQGRLG
jgi:hypothetical protein